MSAPPKLYSAVSPALNRIVACIDDNVSLGRALNPFGYSKTKIQDIPVAIGKLLANARKEKANWKMGGHVGEVYGVICRELDEAYALHPQRDISPELFRFIIEKFGKRLAPHLSLDNFEDAEGKLFASRLALVIGRDLQALSEMKLTHTQIRSLAGRLDAAGVNALYEKYPRQIASSALCHADPEKAAEQLQGSWNSDLTFLAEKLSKIKRGHRIARCIRARSYTSKHSQAMPYGTAPVLLQRYLKCLEYGKRRLGREFSSVAATLALNAYRSKHTTDKPLGSLPELIERYKKDLKYLQEYEGEGGIKVAKSVARSFALISCLKARDGTDYYARPRNLLESYFDDLKWVTKEIGPKAARMIAIHASRTRHDSDNPHGKAPTYIKQFHTDEAWITSQLGKGEPAIARTIAIHSFTSKRDAQHPLGSTPILLQRFREHYHWLLARTTPEIALDIASKSFYHTVSLDKSGKDPFSVPRRYLRRIESITELINKHKTEADGDIARTIALAAYTSKNPTKKALRLLSQYQDRRKWLSTEYAEKTKVSNGNGALGREIVQMIAAQSLRSRTTPEMPMGSAPLLLERYFVDKQLAIQFLNKRSQDMHLNGDLGDLSRMIASRTYNTDIKNGDEAREKLVMGAVDRYVDAHVRYRHLPHLRALFAHTSLWALNGTEACLSYQINIIDRSGAFDPLETISASQPGGFQMYRVKGSVAHVDPVNDSQVLRMIDRAIDQLPSGPKGRVSAHIGGHRRNVGPATAEDLVLFSDLIRFSSVSLHLEEVRAEPWTANAIMTTTQGLKSPPQLLVHRKDRDAD